MLELPVGVSLLILLVGIAFVSGIGITAIGPGGIFVTIALYALTPIPSATVAGTAHAMFVATGIAASLAYLQSGELRQRDAQSMAIILCIASIVGALLGAYVNPFVRRGTFGLLLGLVAVLAGANIVYRERRGLNPLYRLDITHRQDQVVLGFIGLGLGAISGLLGVGGPVLAVPAMVLIGIPMLSALAVAQVQSIFIAGFAATGYYLQGALSTTLAVTLGLPLLAGTYIGWKVAHFVDPDKLELVVGVVLVAVGIHLMA